MVFLKYSRDVCFICANLKWTARCDARGRRKSGDESEVFTLKPTQAELNFAEITNPCNSPEFICSSCRKEIIAPNVAAKELTYPKVIIFSDIKSFISCSVPRSLS